MPTSSFSPPPAPAQHSTFQVPPIQQIFITMQQAEGFQQRCGGRQGMGTTPDKSLLPPPSTCEGCAPSLTIYPALAMFTHSINTRANAVEFSHQSLCNPIISTLLKATQRGFLKGCPIISKTLIHDDLALH